MKSYINSKIGWLELSATEKALESLRFLETKPIGYIGPKNDIAEKAMTELSEYFNGNRTAFTVPLNPAGTDFQKNVWQELQNIPFGQTINYGALAQRLGDINKVRAVGKANGQNPIPIIIPCHRVIGADNNLVGYSGGIARKKYLLKHENAILM